MRVVLQRHAQTASNVLKRYVGSTDEPLCEEGVLQAGRAGTRPEVKRVHTSSLLRARQTAKLIYPQARIIAHAGLDEMDFGRFEGRSWQDMENDDDYRAWVESGCVDVCPGGEGKTGFTERCVSAFLGIMEQEAETFPQDACRENEAPSESARAPLSDEIVFVMHGGTIMAILSELARPQRSYFDWPAGFCGGYILEWKSLGSGVEEVRASRPLRLIEVLANEGRMA